MTHLDARRFMTPPQVGKLLAVDVAKVRAWIRRGELRAADLAEWGAAQRWLER